MELQLIENHGEIATSNLLNIFVIYVMFICGVLNTLLSEAV